MQLLPALKNACILKLIYDIVIDVSNCFGIIKNIFGVDENEQYTHIKWIWTEQFYSNPYKILQSYCFIILSKLICISIQFICRCKWSYFFIIQLNISLITKYFDFSLFLICLKYAGFYAISCLPRKQCQCFQRVINHFYGNCKIKNRSLSSSVGMVHLSIIKRDIFLRFDCNIEEMLYLLYFF